MTIELGEGTLLGRYRLLRLLAKGGMGAVWVGLDERLGREVAVKVLPQMLVSDQAARQRFEREARAMARILHPNVVPVFDVGSADPATGEELPFLVMELVQGSSLDGLLAEGPLPVARAVTIAEQVAQALAAAHGAGIVHRDLKPSNVMVGERDFVKVLDFGLARLLREEGRPADETLTQPGMVLGSCPYMSPEQALGEKVKPASDVFSCGSVLYEMLTGARPFVGSTPVDVLQKVVRGEREPLERAGFDFPPALVAVVDKCLSREPERRYASGSELARDLAAVRERIDPGSDTTPTRRVSSVRVSALHSRRLRRLAAVSLLAAACVAAGILAGAVAARWGMEPKRPDPGAWSVRRLVRVSGQLRHPAWSPGGVELVVEHLVGGASELLMVPAGEGRPHLVESAGSGEVLSFPSFSPDGSALVVTVVGSDSQRLEVIPTVGGEALATVDNAQRGVWTERDLIVFSRPGEGGGGLWSYRPSTGEEKLLFAGSRDRQWWGVVPRPGEGLALLGGSSDTLAGIWVVAPGTGLEVARRWLAPGDLLVGTSWARSGRSMVAVVQGTLKRITETGAVPLLPRLDRLWDPRFDPTGTRIAAVRPQGFNEIISVDPSGEGWGCLLCGVPGTAWGSVGPDGSIVFRRTEAERQVLVLRERDGAERALLPHGEEGSCPSLSPEERRIAYLSPDPEGGTKLNVLALSGGSPVTLVRGVEPSEFPSWSPDGRFITYAGGSPIRVWVVSAAGGEPRLVTPAGGDYPRWSPDGSWIAYVVWTDESDPNQGTWVVRSTGGKPMWIGAHPTQLAWRPDGGALRQVRRENGRLELWEAGVGNWRWRRKSVLDLGVPPPPQMEHLPLTVDRVSGRLLMNRRSTRSELLVFEGVDPTRW